MKIIVCVSVNEEHIKKLRASAPGAEFVFTDASGVTKDMICDADVVFGNVPPDMLKHAEKLALLQLFTAGTDGYTDKLPEGCMLSNTTGAFGLAIGEHLLAVMLMLMKRLHQYRDNQAAHDWRDMGNVTSVEGATVLILGLGDIGSAFAKKVKALGAYTVGVRRVDTSVPDYMDEVHLSGDIDKLIPRADVIAMALPNTDKTRGIMNRERIFSMKQGAMLLNVGRGNAVDTEALADAVESGRILCALDVTDPEPLPPDSRLWGLENAFITPHISGFFHLQKTHDNMVDVACENIGRFIRNEGIINAIDLETGYRRLDV